MNIRALVFIPLLAMMGNCSAQQCGFPRFPVSATSPNGTHVAFVQNHPDIDPPSQSIWLRTTNASATQIRRLGPDSDWCNTVVWSADSSTVSFLIQDARLIAIDARSERIISDKWLVPQDAYPPLRMVTNLSLSSDGSEATFQSCWRNMNRRDRPNYVHDAFGCSEMQNVRIRGEQIPNP